MKTRFIKYLCVLFIPLLFSFTSQDDTLHLHSDDKKLFYYHSEWYSCAKTGRDLLKNKKQLLHAIEWIDHSLDLDINTLNLEIKGDYYLKVGDLLSAIEQYKKALKVNSTQYCLEEDFKRIEKKLAKLNRKKE
ncbi:hypothetical protein KMW28_15520 [Flammeovirga yaeyamensis]|uniref:Tetratricopeptide repeat protein n=1 Tax=Flammeovirga yaeyamensis TaxID=367791 RepID=A0AAX1N3W4_9BACT|nr:hypothetical protein [Flammeovirga yaeyamensis]MBB3698578.1 tetratricopeptide (TPR) repeat protein [Flammeovirga yaeyamensis]NMF34073.1 hypothetical protein [Flammeovirga yaeyamensis]QWG01061.1 hypothetical protein KMW28_15520 [Flammeovirga yaeyamensis]